ncbi:hypothetical protein KIN20_021600 [Parelaphostrongylus tenuis]|uniref:Uncharacterized protein n=1 Tax=Parelaphostrongylus tenuis TaxID=148309 RepID=A0AAD5MP39_PARTN|nr:hypothetical protein KIN20_021600 [Parelaphostrongylus tenuis]
MEFARVSERFQGDAQLLQHLEERDQLETETKTCAQYERMQALVSFHLHPVRKRSSIRKTSMRNNFFQRSLLKGKMGNCPTHSKMALFGEVVCSPSLDMSRFGCYYSYTLTRDFWRPSIELRQTGMTAQMR